jgi:hypothetical protein
LSTRGDAFFALDLVLGRSFHMIARYVLLFFLLFPPLRSGPFSLFFFRLALHNWNPLSSNERLFFTLPPPPQPPPRDHTHRCFIQKLTLLWHLQKRAFPFAYNRQDRRSRLMSMAALVSSLIAIQIYKVQCPTSKIMSLGKRKVRDSIAALLVRVSDI